MNPVSRFDTGPIPLTVSNGASVTPIIRIPPGMAIVGITWPNLKKSVKIYPQVATSITSAARFIRKLNGLDSTSNVGIYLGTAASAPGAAFITDLAGASFMRVALTASMSSPVSAARTFHVTFKS